MSSQFLDDRAVAERVLGHIRNRTTDRGGEVWREPVANYRSAERFEREVGVLRKATVPFCPSAALSEPGSYIARSAAGTPLITVRGKDGRVRAFRNACRHRGTPLASGSGCTKAFVCPYHGWTYQLDGRLQHIPHEDGFPELDPEQHGLVPVAAEEKLGLVFVTQDGPSSSAPWKGLPELVAPEQEIIDTNEAEVEVNWKVYLEGFIEGYHIRSTHRESFYPYGFDNLNVVEQCGPHSRVTYPFRRIEKLSDVPPEDRRVDGLLTYVYHLFPNVIIAVLSHHTNVLVLEPVAIDRTKTLGYTLTNRTDASDAEAAKRDAGFVNQTGVTEDLAIVTAIQRSIRSGANEFFTFGHFESAIAHFHRTLGEALS